MKQPHWDSDDLIPAPERPVCHLTDSDLDQWISQGVAAAGLLTPPAPDPTRFLTALPGGLIVSNLVASRRQGPALDLPALCVPPGERHAVLGPAGAGTTLLLDLIHGTRHPTTGRIWLAGQEITDQSVTRRARWLGRTHQNLSLVLSWSCRDNVLHGDEDPTCEQVNDGLRLLDQIGLAAHASDPAGRLTPGQRRLLDIAVAVAGRPELLLLDDPAADLTDPDLHHLDTLLRGLPTGTAVLLTGHDARLLDTVDWITILDDGRRQASGTPADIRAMPAIRRLLDGSTRPVPFSAVRRRDGHRTGAAPDPPTHPPNTRPPTRNP